MKIWAADQRVDKGGKAIGVCLAFVDVYTCLITKDRRRFVNVYRSLSEDRDTENQSVTNIYTIKGIAPLRIIQVNQNCIYNTLLSYQHIF